MSLFITSEQEAIASVLYAAADINGELSDFETDKIANLLVYCRKFQNLPLKEILAKVFYLKSTLGQVALMEAALPFIPENFKKTLYAMCCDLLCSDGKTNQTDIKLMAFIAGKLGITEDEYLPIATAFMTRYLWNINVETELV